jgi:hypothetical protein
MPIRCLLNHLAHGLVPHFKPITTGVCGDALELRFRLTHHCSGAFFRRVYWCERGAFGTPLRKNVNVSVPVVAMKNIHHKNC